MVKTLCKRGTEGNTISLTKDRQEACHQRRAEPGTECFPLGLTRPTCLLPGEAEQQEEETEQPLFTENMPVCPDYSKGATKNS